MSLKRGGFWMSNRAAPIIWKARLAELRDDHHDVRDPTFLRYIRAFPAAMDDDVIMESHRSHLLLPSDQPQCRGCIYCQRGLRRKHCDKMLANSTLDGPDRGETRQKLQGLPPKPIGKPLNEISCWPAPQDEFPRALFPLREFNANGYDAAGNSVLDRTRQLDLEDAIGACSRHSTRSLIWIDVLLLSRQAEVSGRITTDFPCQQVHISVGRD